LLTRTDCIHVGSTVDKATNSEYADRDVVAAYRVPMGKGKLEDVTGVYRRRYPSR
jgi:hypothetical protein